MEYKTEIAGRILDALESGEKSRPELVVLLGEKRTTILDRLKRLYRYGYVEKEPKSNGKPGRSIVYWRLNEGVN